MLPGPRLIPFLTFLLLMSASCQAQVQNPPTAEEPVAERIPYLEVPMAEDGFLTVQVPRLPDTLSFAGEQVPLWNYDTRESLERELATIIYNHSRTIQILLNRDRFFSLIRPVMREEGLPEDFAYLCVAESSLDPTAISQASAAGLWQFMAPSARQMGLKVTQEVDQRYDLILSTRMASRMLRSHRQKLGSWTLAAAAYNMGLNGLSQRLQKQGVQSYYDSFLPQETMRYVFRILAYKVLMEHPERYGYQKVLEASHPELRFQEVTIQDALISWPEVAGKYGISYKILREWNPWIRTYSHGNTNRTAYRLLVPESGWRTSGDGPGR